jgi:hypothetical protein
MSQDHPTADTRNVESHIEINAPAEVVWKALADAEELTRWFPLQARVTPGLGGSVWISWGPPYEGEAKIEIWEPNRRLRLVEMRSSFTEAALEQTSTEAGAAAEGASSAHAAVPIAVDYFLELFMPRAAPGDDEAGVEKCYDSGGATGERGR